MLIELGFPGEVVHKTVSVHRSRLDFAGGPLPALVPKDYSHGMKTIFCLEKQDSLQDFKYVKRYLYCQTLDFVSSLHSEPAFLNTHKNS